MKRAVISGEREAGLVDAAVPEPRENFVTVRVQVAPMCTEYKAYLSGERQDYLGHEAAGEVVRVAQPCRVHPGDRVVVMPQYPCGKCEFCLSGAFIHCRRNIDFEEKFGSLEGCATMAQYLLKPDWLLVPIPDDVSYEHASMACCGLGPTFGAMDRLEVNAFDTVLITGLGPVGLGGVINARYRGARVIGVDPSEYRAKIALELGAERVIDPASMMAEEQLLELTGGRGFDKAVDCSGMAPAQRLCIRAVRRLGRVAFVGEGGALTVNVSDDMLRKGLTMHGVWHYNLGDAPRVMQIVRDCSDQLDRQITHIFPMSRISEAFEVQAGGDCGKVLLKPWE